MLTDFDLLPDASYRGIQFPVETADTDCGNDFAEHVAYRRRGSDMEPAGQKAYQGSFTIPLINAPRLVRRYGTLFPAKRNDLVRVFARFPLGTLIHPTWGTLEVAILSWGTKDAPDVRNGQRMTVQWKEHNASLSSLVTTDGALTTDPTTTVQQRARAADALCAGAAGYVPIAPVLASKMALLESGVTLTYSDTQGAFAVMFNAIAVALALGSLAGVDRHAGVVALLNVRASLGSYYARFAPGIVGVRYLTVPNDMSVADIAVLAYNDLSKTQLLYAANSFPDPLLVRAGTRVTVLPA